MNDQDIFLKKALLEGGLVDEATLDECSRLRPGDLAAALVEAGALSDREIALVRADVCEVPYVDLADYEVCYDNTRLIPRALAERHCVFPLFDLDGVLTVGTDDPMNLAALDQIRQSVKCEVDAVLCEQKKIESLIARAYSLSFAGGGRLARAAGTAAPSRQKDDAAEGDSLASSRPIVAAVNQLLVDALDQGASDIHINPDEGQLRVRYRIDGVLQEKQSPPLSMHKGIVQRLKVIANLDLTQTRRPQDGKFRFANLETQVEVRLSTLPTVCGENVVLRLLTDRQSIESFSTLGVPADIVCNLEEIIHKPWGMLLVCGPTGSGKTTTLYTAINQINDPGSNIVTIEDPVEIRLPYIRQVQVNTDIGLTFAAALRSILRQDPDVILVGEIRDNETATIALQAALTGHLVLSTLHTNDAAGAVARLRDYGLPSFVINSSVLGVLAQRLVRRVCTHCVGPDEPDSLTLHRFGLAEGAEGFQRGRGCTKCGRTGYRGRVGLFEVLPFTRPVQEAVERGDSAQRIRDIAVSLGMRLMWQDGVDKARLGLTTLHEVAKVAAVLDLNDLRAAA